MPAQRFEEQRAGLCLRPGARNHDHVKACQSRLMHSKALSCETFQPVAPIGAPYLPFRYCKSKPRGPPGAPLAGENREPAIIRTDRAFEYPLEVTRIEEPAIPAKRTVSAWCQEFTPQAGRGPWSSAP